MLRSEMIKILTSEVKELGDGDIYIKTRDCFGSNVTESIDAEYILVDKNNNTIIDIE